MVDIVESRLRLARELGADLTFNPTREDPVRFISSQLKGGTSVVIEAVGIEKTVQQAIQWAARAGKVVIVGLSQKMMSLDIQRLSTKR